MLRIDCLTSENDAEKKSIPFTLPGNVFIVLCSAFGVPGSDAEKKSIPFLCPGKVFGVLHIPFLVPGNGYGNK